MHNLTEGLKWSLYTYLFDGYATLVARSIHLHIYTARKSKVSKIISGAGGGRGGSRINYLAIIIIELSRQRIRLVSIHPGTPRSTGIRETLFRERRPWRSVRETTYLIRGFGPGLVPVRRCVFNYSIIHPAIHHQPSVKFILFLCIGPLQLAAPYISLLLAAICLARAASNSPLCRFVESAFSNPLTRARAPREYGPLFFSRKLTRRNRKKRAGNDRWPHELEYVDFSPVERLLILVT